MQTDLHTVHRHTETDRQTY